MICGNVDINGRKTYIEITEDVHILNLIGCIIDYYKANFFRFNTYVVKVKGLKIIDQEFLEYSKNHKGEIFYADDKIFERRECFIPTKEPIKAKIKRIIEEFRK